MEIDTYVDLYMHHIMICLFAPKTPNGAKIAERNIVFPRRTE